MATKPSSFGNSALSNAKRAKNDEFYTQWAVSVRPDRPAAW